MFSLLIYINKSLALSVSVGFYLITFYIYIIKYDNINEYNLNKIVRKELDRFISIIIYGKFMTLLKIMLRAIIF